MNNAAGSWWRRLLNRNAQPGVTGAETPTNAADSRATTSPDPGGAEHATPADRRWMTRALELARQAAARGEVPVGAVVYDTTTGEQIAEASNTRQKSNDPTGHAELLAVRAAAAKLGDWRLTGCTVVVTLEPCPMCAGMLVNARVGRVVYGADDPKAGACRSLFAITTDARLNHCCEVVAGLEADACGRVLTEFFRKRRHEQRPARTPPRSQHNDHNAEAPDDA